ncbi:alpha/beta fold hydrolase [Catenulispora pinisilvae]|uniref:alpha/beta fold hydrolase n=1 Tax=Catenulispora pinisilvae TaxID=2705253 RepID=UPI0018925FC4|nr:alpha/beta fold hydrolase [Catenulispora pinisilvae]
MQLSYARRGSGTPLVLIHGIGHRWQAWEPVLDRLAEHHDVIAIDIPGFGKSAPLLPAPGRRYTIEFAMSGIADSFAGFGIERPHVAGNSLGGALALELARHGHAASVTAFSPAGFWQTRWETAWATGNLSLSRAATFAPKPVLRYVADHETTRGLAFGMIFGRPRRLDPAQALGDTLAMREGRSFRPVAKEARHYRYAGESDVPTTVAWGTKDRILLHRQFEQAKRILPKARFEDLPGCGHVPMNDDPERVSRLILETTGAISVEP